MSLNKYFSASGLFRVIVFFITIALVISCVSLFFTIKNNELYSHGFCLESKCVDFFIGKINGVLSIATAFGWIVTIVTTVGGVLIALQTYEAGVKNSNITNHIANMNMFRDYINMEILKRNHITPDKINIYKWYNLIHPKSKEGDISISPVYLELIGEVINVIEEANDCVTDPAKEYKYKIYQGKIMVALNKLGVIINRGPKNNFIEVEKNLLELIDCVNMTFTNFKVELSLIKKNY